MTLMDLSQIPQYPMKDGFNIRNYSPGDESVWYKIQRSAEPYLEIYDGLFEQEFGQNIDALKNRCFFLCKNEMTEIGTVTAWWNENWRGERWGQVHWMAINPDYQGLGLCKTLMTAVMNRIRQSDRKCYLRTSTGRIPAIKVYIDFGFSPDPSNEDEKQAWIELSKNFDHPALREFLA